MQARRAQLALHKKIHALRYGRAVRRVQRAFRQMPERVIASLLRGMVTSVVVFSVAGSAEATAARRIASHARKMATAEATAAAGAWAGWRSRRCGSRRRSI